MYEIKTSLLKYDSYPIDINSLHKNKKTLNEVLRLIKTLFVIEVTEKKCPNQPEFPQSGM